MYLPIIHTIFRRTSYIFFVFGSFSWFSQEKLHSLYIFAGFILLFAGVFIHFFWFVFLVLRSVHDFKRFILLLVGFHK